MSTGPYASLSPQLVACLYNALQPRPWATQHLRAANLGDPSRGIERHHPDDATARRIAVFEPLLDVLSARAPADSELGRNVVRTVVGLSEIKDDDLAGLALLPNLTRVIIQCKVDAPGIAHLSRAKGLRELAITKLTGDAVNALAALTQIEVLDLRGVSTLSDAHVPILRALPRVHTLYPGKGLTSAGLIALVASGPPHERALRALHVTGLDDATFAAILSRESPITRYTDTASKVTDAGIAAADLSCVEVLALARASKLTDASLASILSRAPRLTTLTLDGAKITDKALLDPANAAALKRLAASTFRELDLGSTRLTDASVPTLASLAGLTLLRVAATKISAAAIGDLTRALPGCNVVHLG